jgi:hypothetical protein
MGHCRCVGRSQPPSAADGAPRTGCWRKPATLAATSAKAPTCGGRPSGQINVKLHHVNIAAALGNARTAIDTTRAIHVGQVDATEREASLLIEPFDNPGQFAVLASPHASPALPGQPDRTPMRPIMRATVRFPPVGTHDVAPGARTTMMLIIFAAIVIIIWAAFINIGESFHPLDETRFLASVILILAVSIQRINGVQKWLSNPMSNRKQNIEMGAALLR